MMRFIYGRCHQFNYEFVKRNFGIEVYGLFRSWTDLNYRSIRIVCRLNFLKQCKNLSLFPTHLTPFSESRFYLVDHKSKHNLIRLFHNTKRKILNIESFDLHRQLQKIKREIATISRNLSDQLPVYMWRDIYDRNNWFLQNTNVRYR